MAKTPRTWTGARSPSGLKRVRQAERRHAVLQPRRTAAKTLVAKAVRTAATPTDGVDVQLVLNEAISALDRAAKTGAIHPNAAARRKSRLVIKVNAALGGVHIQAGRAAKATGKAAAAKAAKARIAAGRAGKAKGAQTAAGKARAALSRTARTDTTEAKAPAATEAPAKAGRARSTTTRASAAKASTAKASTAKSTGKTAASKTPAKSTAKTASRAKKAE